MQLLTNNSSPLSLFDHLYCSVLVAEHHASEIDRDYAVKLLGRRYEEEAWSGIKRRLFLCAEREKTCLLTLKERLYNGDAGIRYHL